ncbi:C40 family peptidase [Streptomyces sp. 891-h]|uniref:C40 family peptidase n=1 Tax=Streptomyces sp. 891-h TaxID=2720714 RepID=UPI001FA9A382|nr:C40 family peptidase [Streptomyces sp. 891-h]UNZ22302.1 C40 family peptidase [Streptomyces sp. 891-h]
MHPLALAASRRGRRWGLVVLLGALAAAGMAFLLISQAFLSAAAAPMSGLPCPAEDVAVGEGDGKTGLNAKQIKNAQIIIATGQKMQVPARGQVVAITAALQESGLRNLKGGDRDSVGLFQMRPSQGWGTAKQLTNPRYSSKKFYRALLSVPGWQNMSVTAAAQKVEKSGFPRAYAKHKRRAVQIVASVGRGTAGVAQVDTTGCTAVVDTPAGPTGTALAVMKKQVGKPYKWGATGPDSFDCSGLIVYAWRKAGYQLSVRTSQQMHTVSTPIKSGQEKPGDLIFTEFEQGGPAHVMVVLKKGTAIEAPRTGLDVRIRKYNAKQEGAKFGRLPKSALSRTTGA